MEMEELILTSITVGIYTLIISVLLIIFGKIFKSPLPFYKGLLYGFVFSAITAIANYFIRMVIHEDIIISLLAVLSGLIGVFVVGKLIKEKKLSLEMIIDTGLVTLGITLIYLKIISG